MQPDIQLQGNESLGHSGKKTPNSPDADWLAHTWTAGVYHAVRQCYKSSSISVLIHGVSLGPEASFMSKLVKIHSGEMWHRDSSEEFVLIDMVACLSMALFATQMMH